MRKPLYILILLVLSMLSCSKEKEPERETYSFAASLVSGTKADDGKGDYVNRCIMEIYYAGSLYTRQVSPMTDKTASFTVQMVPNRTYNVTFWADCGNSDLSDLYYNTSSVTNIEIVTPYQGSMDARDAFCYSGEYIADNSPSSTNVKLTRPFAQVNTTKESYSGSGVSVSFDAPASYNLLTDELGAAETFSYTNTGLYSEDPKVLSMDYIFAPSTQTNLTLVVDGTPMTVPVKRNFKTNITL